jgi:hypothetical protein
MKHFKDGNTDIADQPRCGQPRTAAKWAQQAKSRRAQQIRPKDNNQKNCSAAWSGEPCGSGDGDFGISESFFPLGSPVVLKRTAGNYCPIHPTFRIWPP